jgi:PAS domain S-box-containing protein
VPDVVLRDVSRRLRGLLSAEDVMHAAADACAHALGVRSFSVWLSTGRQPPRLAYARPRRAPDEPPLEVSSAVRRRRPAVRLPNGDPLSAAAVPLIAPRSGLLGAIFVERDELQAAESAFLEFLAQEAALALETANIYEQAVAARDRSDALLARVADAIVVTDPRGKVLHTNDAARWILDRTFRSNDGMHCADALALHSGERELDCTEGCALLALAHDGDASGQEVWRARADGGRQPMLANTAAVTDADGTVTEIVHSLRDITRLKQADEAKTLFLATASHELKTPLTVIQGYSELLAAARINNDEEREQAALAIQRRAVQLNKIVDRLLLSSRIETGRVEVEIAEVSMLPIVTERVQALHATNQRDILIEVGEPPPTVSGDAAGITTVLDHLLDNAVKYSPGGGAITVGIGFDDERVAISVADRGIGMDPEQASHCFEKFWQAESTDGRRFGGTGIGLYIVRSLVEAMGGRISVETAPGAGSTFVVALRRWGAQQRAERPDDAPARPITPEPSVIREFMRQIGIPSGRTGR